MADNTNTLQLTISVKDDGSVVVDTVKGKVQGLGDATESASKRSGLSLSSLKENWFALAAGVTAGYLAIKKSIDALNSFVSAASDAQRIEARMAFQIETVGISYQKIKGAVDAFANSLEHTTRFGDEAAREALGQMMMYTEDLGRAMEATRLAMDMSTQTGMDLQTTTRYLGMALGGNVEMLGKYILELRNLDDTLGQNATQAEKTAYAFDLLNKKFQGAAQKDLQTYAGALEKMKNQWDDIKEVIGTKLMPYWDQWVAGVNSYFGTITKTNEAQKKLKEGMASVTEESRRAVALAAAEKEYAELIKMDKAIREAPQEVYTLEEAMKELGITSQASMQNAQFWTNFALERIKKDFKAGKIAALDYANALQAAMEKLKKGYAETQDPLSKLIANEEEYQKKIREISLEDPDRQKKVQAAIDDWLKARQTIVAESQKPISIIMSNDEALRKINELERDFEKTKDKIESQVINFKANIPEIIESNVDFTGSGSSKKPIMDKLAEISAGFTTWGDQIQKMEAEISFHELSTQLAKLQSQYDFQDKIIAQSKMLSSLNITGGIGPYGTGGGWGVPEWVRKQVETTKEDLFDQMKMLQMRSTLAQLNAGMGDPIDLVQRFYQLSGSSYIPSVYQHGTPYVPETGLALVHRGERITPANQNYNMGGIVLNFTIKGNGKQAAEEIAHALKYQLSGSLREAIKKLKK